MSDGQDASVHQVSRLARSTSMAHEFLVIIEQGEDGCLIADKR